MADVSPCVLMSSYQSQHLCQRFKCTLFVISTWKRNTTVHSKYLLQPVRGSTKIRADPQENIWLTMFRTVFLFFSWHFSPCECVNHDGLVTATFSFLLAFRLIELTSFIPHSLPFIKTKSPHLCFYSSLQSTTPRSLWLSVEGIFPRTQVFINHKP